MKLLQEFRQYLVVTVYVKICPDKLISVDISLLYYLLYTKLNSQCIDFLNNG
jgi:hypothetical protein